MKYLLLLLLLPLSAFAQELGLNPPATRWLQYRTPAGRVIFPQQTEAQGQQVARLSMAMLPEISSLGPRLMPIDVFLHNRTVNANGFVTLLPYRSEFFLTPPQNNFLGAGTWLDLLTLHEYRHVQQISNFNRSKARAVGRIFGRTGLAFMFNSSLPNWFTEGDATLYETAVSSSGRGRQPDFDMEYRALRLADRNYGFEKAVNGSFRDFVPSHYHLGYYLTTYGRRKYGPEIWQNAVRDAAKVRGLIFPFSSSVKRSSGNRLPGYYRATIQNIDSLFTKWEGLEPLFPTQQLSPEPSKFTSYSFPAFTNEGQLLVVKSSFDQIRTLGIFANGEFSKLIKPGFTGSPNHSLRVGGGKVLWAETLPNPRWFMVEQSAIRSYDIGRQEAERLASKQRYFSPAPSADGSQLVAVEVNDAQQVAVVLLNATGELQEKLPNPEQWFFSHPILTETGEVVAVAQHRQQMALVRYQQGQWQEVLPFQQEKIIFPIEKEGKIYFTAAFNGSMNIYAIDVESGQKHQLTNSATGAFYPAVSPDGRKLVYSEFSALGYKLMQAELPKTLPVIDQWPSSKLDYYQPVAQQEQQLIQQKPFGDPLPPEKYRKTSGLFNPYGIWINNVFPTAEAELRFGNRFQTLEGALGVSYNTNESSVGFGGSATFGAWFPYLEAGFETLLSREFTTATIREIAGDSTSFGAGFEDIEFDEANWFAGVSIPLNFNRGIYRNSAFVRGRFHAISTSGYNLQEAAESYGDNLTALEFRGRLQQLQRQALQHIYPRTGYTLDASYKNGLGSSELQAEQLRIRGDVFVPGFFRTHGIRLGYAYQTEDFLNSYQFADAFPYPRGYGRILNDNIGRWSANYMLPLLYPDLGLGGLLFLKRVKAELFVDVAQVRFNDAAVTDLLNLSEATFEGGESVPFSNQNNQYRSFGVELRGDFRFFRLSEADLGVRFSYLPDLPADRDPYSIQLVIGGLNF